MDYVSDFTDQTYGKSDFLAMITKRIKKDLRNNEKIDLKRSYYLEDKGVKTEIAVSILGMIFANRLDVVIIPKGESLDKSARKIDDTYLEEYIKDNLEVFFKRKNIDELKSDSIPILRSITYNELKQLKEIFEIDGEIEKGSLEFVEGLQQKYKQTKSSFLRSITYIKEIL